MIAVETIRDAEIGMHRCADLFEAERLGCNMVAGALHPDREIELLRAHEGDRTLGAAIAWPPGFTLTTLRTGAAGPLATALPIDRDIRLMGEVGDAALVAGVWSERCGGAIEAVEVFRMYRLGELHQAPTPGRAVQLGAEHVDLGSQWAIEFGEQTGLGISADEARSQMSRVTDQGGAFGWELDGAIVSHLLVSVPRMGVVRIGGVYTPQEHRGHRYGSALTAAVSEAQRSRHDVDDVILNTQASNAMTNRIYRRLGYESIFETLIVWLRTP